MTLLLLLGCAYEVPADPDAPEVKNVLSGTVVVNGADVVGDTVILLYNVANPPPPVGTGRPVTFATVPASAFSTDAGGVPSAEWSMSLVPNPDASQDISGDWVVTALMDMDGNFNPLYTATAGSTCGDWSGAYFSDILAGEVAVVHAEGGEHVDGITVAVGAEYATQRPAWQFVEDETYDTTIGVTLGETIRIESVGVFSDLFELPGPYDGTADCQTAFWQYAPDEDGDGVTDPHPNENFAERGMKALWPRVFLRYLGDDVEDGYYGTELAWPSTLFNLGLPDPGTMTPLTTYDLAFAGKAIHFYEDGTEELVEGDAIPRGPWSVSVFQYTGQTWTLPNELGDWPASDGSFDPALQSHFLTIE